MIEAPPRGDDPGAGPVIAPRSLLKGIIAPRVEETLELLRERLKASGAPGRAGRRHRADRRRQPAGRRARSGRAGVRPPGAPGPAAPRAAPGRRRLRARPSAPPPASCTAPPSARARPVHAQGAGAAEPAATPTANVGRQGGGLAARQPLRLVSAASTACNGRADRKVSATCGRKLNAFEQREISASAKLDAARDSQLCS